MKFLHISDLHFDPENDGVATKQLRDALERDVKDRFHVDEVFFTGDFRHAERQKKQNQDEVIKNAVEFLREIAAFFDVTDDKHIHIVPGNHDFDDKGPVLTKIYEEYCVQNGRFEGETESGEKYLDYLRSRFGFFETCAKLLNNEVWQDFKIGDVHRIRFFESFSVIYLNTVIAASGRTGIEVGKRPNLYIGLDYFYTALNQLKGKNENPVIFLAHNPFDHIHKNEKRQIKNLISDSKINAIWFCGDVHEPDQDNINGVGYITAGSFIQEYGTIATFNIGTLDDDGCFSFEIYQYDNKSNGWGKNDPLTKRNNDAVPENLKPRKKKLTADNNLLRQNKYFSSRDNDLVAIDKLFREKDNTAVNICQTVAGLGGVGKTQLAIEYAYRYGGNYENCVWFIVAENSTTIYNYFIDFTNHFKITLPPDFKPEDLQWAIKSWLHDHNNWFLIFDNLENYADIEPYLPNSNNGHFIITTRKDNIGVGAKLGLGVFNMKEALEFLQKRLVGYGKNELNFTDFNEMASILVDRLGGLPLALEQAAAYIVKVKCSISTYLKYIEESDLKVFDDEYATPEHYEAIVNTTWKISMDILSQEAQWLFNLCAYMAPDRIPVNFFVEMRHKLPDELSTLRDNLGEVGTRARIITSLFEYSLASGNNEYINIHRLVQEVVRKSHEAENASQKI